MCIGEILQIKATFLNRATYNFPRTWDKYTYCVKTNKTTYITLDLLILSISRRDITLSTFVGNLNRGLAEGRL
jgi:hypothetical protein